MAYKKAFIFTMYNEAATILASLANLNYCFDKDDYFTIIVHSFDSDSAHLHEAVKLANKYIRLENLGSKLDKFELPAAALCRNYSAGFSTLYESNFNADYIVAATADTYLLNPIRFDTRYEEMMDNKWLAYVSKAYGQRFHASTDNPAIGKECGRLQTEDLFDFMPQFFIVDGKTAIENKLFANIQLINKFTSEECLGNELNRVIKNHDQIGILNSYSPNMAYAYSDVQFNVK